MTNEAAWMPEITREDLSRRRFLKWSAIAGGTAAVAGAGWKLGLVPIGGSDPAQAAEMSATGAKTVWSSCNVNCGSRCPLRMHVVDGQIVRIDPDNTGTNELGSQQIRACLRGRSIRKRIYNPERLKYPMKRVGERGSGEFARISWDEAFATVASSLKKTIAEYGNEAVFINYGTGTIGGTVTSSWPPGGSLVARLMNCCGGFLDEYGDYSAAQIEAVVGYYYGTWVGSNSFDDVVNSKLVVLWGNNPQETRMSGGGETFVLEQAHKISGAKVIVVDPRYSDSAVTLTDEWVPLRPGTDPALVAGMAYVMISENLHDQAFLDKYCVGFDEEHMPAGIPANSSYKSYVLGLGPDKTKKTPQWAEQITGLPAQRIVELAREIAQTKPCSITQGWGPQRTFNGDATARAVFLLATMTGNVGIPGGGTGARERLRPRHGGDAGARQPGKSGHLVLHLDRGNRARPGDDGSCRRCARRRQAERTDQVPRQYAGNALINQHGDTNRTDKILKDTSKCEMIVVIDNQMTPSARYADIILPDVSNAEQADLIQQGAAGPLGYTILASKAIEPLFECKTIYEICSGVAKQMGVEEKFTEGKTQEEWLRLIVAQSQAAVPGLPSYDDLAEMGIWRQPPAADHTQVALESFRQDPKKNPLLTPSGKIEIFSKQLWDLNKTWILPKGEQIAASQPGTTTRRG